MRVSRGDAFTPVEIVRGVAVIETRQQYAVNRLAAEVGVDGNLGRRNTSVAQCRHENDRQQ